MEQRIDYYIGQLLNNIEQMEKIIGKPYDVEKAAEKFEAGCKSEVLWGEINLLNSAIPAPIDMKSLMTFFPLTLLLKGDQRVIEFYETLRDEVKDRIAKGIAAVPNERYRMIFTVQPPWSSLALFRRLEDYGVVFITNHTYIQDGFGRISYNDDGSLSVTKTPKERGWPSPRNKEELVKTWVQWKLLPEARDYLSSPAEKALEGFIMETKYFKVDGVVLGVNRGCKPLCYALLDYKLALEEAGVPSMTLEFNNADFRENDDGAMLRQIEAFVETLE